MGDSDKFSKLNEQFGFIRPGSVVLCAGGSPGFVSFASEAASKIFCIDMVKKSYDDPKVRFTEGNILKDSILKVTGGSRPDLFVNELGLRFVTSIQAAERVVQVMGDNGRVLMFVKSSPDPDDVLVNMMEGIGLRDIRLAMVGGEKFIYGVKQA